MQLSKNSVIRVMAGDNFVIPSNFWLVFDEMQLDFCLPKVLNIF